MFYDIFRILNPFLILTLIIPTLYWAFKLIGLNFKEKTNKKAYLIGLCLLVFFSMWTLRLWTEMPHINWYDDQDYLAHSASFSYFKYPSYEDEFIPGDGRFQPIAVSGVSIMAFPFTFFGASGDKLLGHNIAEKRTAANLHNSNLQFSFILATIFWATLAIFLWSSALRFYSTKTIIITMLAGIFLIGLPIFIWRRPIFTHSYEFFLQSLWVITLWLGSLYKKQGLWPTNKLPSFKFIFLLSALASLTVLTRINNLCYALFWPLLILGLAFGKTKNCHTIKHYFIACMLGLKKVGFKRLFTLYSIIAFFLFWFIVMPNYFNPKNLDIPSAGGYEGNIAKITQSFHSPLIYIKRIWHIFTGIDMGLIFTSPFIIIGIYLLCQKKYSKNVRAWALPAALVSLINFYFVLIWGSYGSSYGYRYLVFSLSPILILVFANSLEYWQNNKKNIYIILISLILILPLCSQTFFQTILKYEPVPIWFKNTTEKTMGRLYFQKEIYEILLNNPLFFFKSLFKVFINFFKFPIMAIWEQKNIITEIRYFSIFILPIVIYFGIIKKLIKNVNLNLIKKKQ